MVFTVDTADSVREVDGFVVEVVGSLEDEELNVDAIVVDVDVLTEAVELDEAPVVTVVSRSMVELTDAAVVVG